MAEMVTSDSGVGSPDFATLFEAAGASTLIDGIPEAFPPPPPAPEVLGVRSSAESREQLWSTHPFGRPLLRSVMDGLAAIGDCQTLAAATCVLRMVEIADAVQCPPSQPSGKSRRVP